MTAFSLGRRVRSHARDGSDTLDHICTQALLERSATGMIVWVNSSMRRRRPFIPKASRGGLCRCAPHAHKLNANRCRDHLPSAQSEFLRPQVSKVLDRFLSSRCDFCLGHDRASTRSADAATILFHISIRLATRSAPIFHSDPRRAQLQPPLDRTSRSSLHAVSRFEKAA